jgi:CRISPR-associated protein Cas1
MRNNKSMSKDISSELARLSKAVLDASDIESVRGYEGQAANLYFSLFGSMVKGQLGEKFTEHGRSRRPPPDPVNSCLSMAYTLLTHECVAAIRLARLEPSIGALHISRPGRPALALDLMEPFRPLISDSIAITAFNREELRLEHFRQTSAGCMFTDQGRRVFFEIYGKRMNTCVTHPVFGYRLCYRRMLVLHARMIAAWLMGEVQNLAFLTTR